VPHHQHYQFVLLSLVVAVFGAWTALDLFRRVRSHIGRARRVWLGAAALAMGFSIWSMHFIAMLGFDPGSPVRYDLPLTALSLLLAIGATLGAFFAASREGASKLRIVLAGCAMGAGICLMHYVGMAALRSAVSLGYRPSFVVASFLIAIVAATAALFVAPRERSVGWRTLAAVLLGLAIVGMHYTAMAGLKLTAAAGGGTSAAGAPPSMLGVGVAGGSILILVLALVASLYDERMNVLGSLEAGRIGYWELSLPDLTLHVSARGKEIMGRAADDPFTHDDFLASLDAEAQRRREAEFKAVLAGLGDYDAEYDLVGEGAEPTTINIRGRVVSWRGGRPSRMSGVILDVTDRRRAYKALAEAEARQRLLIDELNHRVKNTLATVQSIARQTAKSADTIEEYREAFEARLLALSLTHNALTRGHWESASLRELLEQELSPYRAEQVSLTGADVQLPQRLALALGMSFHELATNSAKYGALSSADGCVRVDFRHGPDHVLDLTWKESGGPQVAPPSRTGFGTKLLRTAVMGELAGDLAIRFEPDGLFCRIVVPTK
jgi:NO-binding membrane sensor protein with MHYT domain/two-component sensor histidine kinase